MIKSLTATAVAAFLALSATAAFAQTELDSEKAFKNFSSDSEKGTVILRVDKNGNGAIASVRKVPKNDSDAQELAKTAIFIPLPDNKKAGEPNSEFEKKSSLSSWYVAWGGWGPGYYSGWYSYPYYPYYGYTPYYYPVYYYNNSYYNP